jgi:hypothetical protein
MVKCKCYIYTFYVEKKYNVDNIIFSKWINQYDYILI